MRIRTVQFGLTDACNMNCLMCTRARVFQRSPERRPGFMDPELFRRVVGELAESGHQIDLIFLAWIGESLLHPRFPEFVDIVSRLQARKPFFSILAVNTNGSCTDEAFASAMLAAAARCPQLRVHVAFSLDAWYAETHRRIKGRDDGAEVHRRTEEFLRRNAGAGHPVTVHISALVLEENQSELGEFVAGWSEFLGNLGYEFRVSHDPVAPGDARNLILLRRAILPDQPAADRLHRRAALAAGLIDDDAGPRIVAADSISKNYRDETIFAPQFRRPPCPALWQYPTIHWDGRVTLCCKDTDLALVVGDLKKESFRQIWENGEKIERFRRWHLAGDFHLLPECATCGNYDVEAIRDEDLADALAGTPLEDWRDWAGRRKITDLAEKLEDFRLQRPERWPELEKAMRFFRAAGRLEEAAMTEKVRWENLGAFLRSLLDEGREDEARACLVERFEESLDSHFGEIVAAYQRDGEIEGLEALLELDPLVFLRETIDGVPESLIRYTDLELIYQKLRDRFGLYRDVGNHWYRAGDYVRALNFYKPQLERDPDDLSALKQTAFCAYHLKDHLEGLAAASRALKIGADFEMERLLGHIYLEESQFGKAAEHFARALELDADDWLCQRGLLVARHRLGAKDLRDLAIHVLETAPAGGDTEEVRQIIAASRD